MHISSYEDLIYGEDGHSPIRQTIEDALARAKADGTRLRVEVRTKPNGAPSNRQEHAFVADPNTSGHDAVMRVLVEKLEGSPGPEFDGQIRINFMQSSNSGERYGSWTRSVRYRENITQGVMHPGTRMRSPGEEELDEDGNSMAALDGEGFGMPMNMPPGMMRGMMGGGMVDENQMRQWLETTMGFAFRSMAQQMQMFERATRMMEAYTLRFGYPHPTEAGITEIRGEPDRGGGNQGGGGGAGLLPMLLNAAAHLANADSPAQVVQRSAEMATGAPPPQGAARAAAIRGAANAVNALQRIRQPAEGFEDAPDLDDGPPESDYGMGYEADGYEGGEEDYGGEEHDFGGHGGGGGPMGPPDLTGLSPDEMRDAVISWVRSDPANKSAVMRMLPELSKEIM